MPNKLSKLLLRKTETNLGSQITDLSKKIKDTLTYFKKLEADIAVVKTVNNRLVERFIKKERPCWENAQYSRRDTLEIVGIPNSIGNSFLEETVRGVLIGVKDWC